MLFANISGIHGVIVKRLALIFIFVASAAHAVDIIHFKNGMTFNHKIHQSEKVGNCIVCHDNVQASKDGKQVTTNEPGKITGFGEVWAHKYCTDCHDTFGEGPVKCPDCHKKDMAPK